MTIMFVDVSWGQSLNSWQVAQGTPVPAIGDWVDLDLTDKSNFGPITMRVTARAWLRDGRGVICHVGAVS